VPSKEGNEGCEKHHHEEWQTGNSGRMPRMRNQDVQDREELAADIVDIGTPDKAGYLETGASLFVGCHIGIIRREWRG